VRVWVVLRQVAFAWQIEEIQIHQHMPASGLMTQRPDTAAVSTTRMTCRSQSRASLFPGPVAPPVAQENDDNFRELIDDFGYIPMN
jgi:hypothetical protein